MKKYVITVLNSKIPVLVDTEAEFCARSFAGAARQFKRKYHLRGEFIAETQGVFSPKYVIGNFWTKCKFGGLSNTGTRIFINQ